MMLSLLIAASAPLVDPPVGEVEVLPHTQLNSALAELASAHECASLIEYGSSGEGRALVVLRLAPPGEREGSPAILVVGGVEGERVWESGLVLSHARALAAGYGTDARATAMLEAATLYFIPRAEPDGAEARFHTPLRERSATGHDVDNDRDGRRGEDGPLDLDGDGWIVSMRVPDPDGEWTTDERDPRAMLAAEPSTAPELRYALHVEGRDADGDGEIAEDASADGSFASNFPAGWQEHAPEADRFPTSMPAVRALCDFIIERPELALVLIYGAQDNLVAGAEQAGGDGGRIPTPGVIEADAELVEQLGEAYREATGIEEGRERALAQDGSFARWAYEHRGLWTLCASPWVLPESAPPEEGDEGADEAETEEGEEAVELDGDAGRLAWIEARGEAWRFRAWTSFEHPELGAVELGGFAAYAMHEPPMADWQALADAQYDFLLGLGEQLPRVVIEEASAEELGGGLWRLTAKLRNRSALPYSSAAARRARSMRPIRVRLLGAPGAQLLAGSRQELVSELDAHEGQHEIEWLVNGTPDGAMRIEIDTDHAGRATRAFEVQ